MAKKLGRELVVGDELWFLNSPSVVTGFEEHPGLDYNGEHFTARIAVTEDWSMTVFDDDDVTVTVVKEGRSQESLVKFAKFLDGLLS